jgi:hypothetical protein
MSSIFARDGRRLGIDVCGVAGGGEERLLLRLRDDERSVLIPTFCRGKRKPQEIEFELILANQWLDENTLYKAAIAARVYGSSPTPKRKATFTSRATPDQVPSPPSLSSSSARDRHHLLQISIRPAIFSDFCHESQGLAQESGRKKREVKLDHRTVNLACPSLGFSYIQQVIQK